MPFRHTTGIPLENRRCGDTRCTGCIDDFLEHRRGWLQLGDARSTRGPVFARAAQSTGALEANHDRNRADGLVRAQIGPPYGAGIGSCAVPRAVAEGFR